MSTNNEKKKARISISKLLVYLVAMGAALLYLVIPRVFVKVSVVDVEDSSLLDAVLNSEGESYVYFGKSSCSQCYKFEKYIDAFDRYLPDIIYHVDTEYWKEKDQATLKEVCDKYDIEVVPTIIIVDDGSYVGKLDVEQMFVDNGIVY